MTFVILPDFVIKDDEKVDGGFLVTVKGEREVGSDELPRLAIEEMGIDDNLLPDQVEAVNNGDMELYFFVIALLRVKGLVVVEMKKVGFVS